MTQINFIDKEHEIILLDGLYPYFDHDGIDIGKVYPLLESKEIIKELNKIMVGVDVDPKDINDQIFEFKYLANKYLKDEESKILIPKIKNIGGTLIIPLKVALIFDIWSGFADKLYQPQIAKNTSKKFYEKYTDKAFEIADIYTMIFCKGYNQEHYYLDKGLYWEAKEMFGKLDDLNIREQQKERKLLKKFCSFLEELDSIEETEEKNLLGMKISKKNFKTILEKGKGRISPYDTVLFLRIFTDIKPILCLVKNGLHSLKLLPYEISLYGEKSLYNNIILKRKDCSIFSPFREFQTPVNKGLEERNKLNEHLSNSSSSKTHCNEILDKCIKDIEKCARIGANRLEIKFNNHIPTEMTHYLSVGKSADNIGDIKDYILNEGGGPSHFGSTSLGGSKVAFEGRKKYSYKTNGKIP